VNAVSPSVASFEHVSLAERLREHLGALNRRKWPIAITFVTGVVIALLIAALLPSTYRAAGTVLIEQQEIPEDFVRSAVQSFADQRVRVISQRVMTTQNLLDIIERHGLYGADRGSVTRERLLERIRKDIELEMISADVVDPRRGGVVKATIAFAVAFQSDSADLAASVANDLVSLYLRENLETRKQLAQESSEFLADEADRLRLRTEELAQKIAEFKRQNYGRLPEFATANITELVRMGQEQREASSAIRALDLQLATLDSQLDLVDLGVTGGSGEARSLSPGDQLNVLRAQRAAASARYSPSHPDVRRLEREIGQLEKSIAEGTTGAEAAQGSGAGPASSRLEAQRQFVLKERADLVARRDSLQQAIAASERAQKAMPEVEQEYRALTVEAQAAQERYAEIRRKLLAAELSQNLETEQKGERFTLIDPPVRPQEPISPNRGAIRLVGVILALVASIGVLLLLELLDTRIRGPRQLASLVGQPPLATVRWQPEPDSSPSRLPALDQRWLLIAGVAAVPLMLALVHFLYRPLDVLWAVILRRLGLGA